MEKLQGESEMKTCYLCKGDVRIRKTDHLHQWKGKFYLFKKIKAEICDQCGETYLLPQSLKYIDEIVNSSVKARQKMSVPVFSAPQSVSV